MAEKLIVAEKARLSGSAEHTKQAEAAFARIQQLTKRYNDQTDGKWRGMMDYRPRNLPVFDMPATTANAATAAATPVPQPDGAMVIDPTNFAQPHDRAGAGWRVVEGLGPRGRAIAVLPHMDTPTLSTPLEIRERARVAEFNLQMEDAGRVEVVIEALPTHPLTPAHKSLVAVSINDDDPVLIDFEQGANHENDRIWQQNVLRGAMLGKAALHLPARPSKLKLWAADAGVVVQRITLNHQPIKTGSN